VCLHRIRLSLLLATLLGALPAGADEPSCPEGTSLHEREVTGARDAWCARPDGILHGPYRSWHANGKPRSATHYVNGVEHGQLQAWHPDGTLALEAQLVDAKVEGTWQEWHANGQLAVQASFEAGEPTGVAEWWYESGAKRLEGRFTGFANDGVWTTWWENGARRRQCTWRGGVLEGPCRGWDEAGAERFAVRYVALPQARRFSYWRSNGELGGYEILSAWEPLEPGATPANAAD